MSRIVNLGNVVGPAGKDGVDGKDGLTPTIEINENGYWVVNGVVTNVKAVGEDGTNGTDGRDGAIQYIAGENIIIDENNVISAAGGEKNVYYFDMGTNTFNKWGTSDSGTHVDFTNKVCELYDKGTLSSAIFLMKFNGNNCLVAYNNAGNETTRIVLNGILFGSWQYMMSSINYSSNPGYANAYCSVYVNRTLDTETGKYIPSGTFSENVDRSYSPLSKQQIDNAFLPKGNTTAYTPTTNYSPATKQYVDDQVGSINTVLATLTTVSEVSE